MKPAGASSQSSLYRSSPPRTHTAREHAKSSERERERKSERRNVGYGVRGGMLVME